MRQCPKCGKRFLVDAPGVCDVDGSVLEHVVLASDRERLVGAVVGGDYQIDGVVGDGGMGVVYRARRGRDGLLYAIKVLRSEYSADQDLVHRFQQEAESAAAIQHPNIVRVLEFGSLPDASRFFVMEYLEGRSLGKLLQEQGRNPTTGKRRALPEWLAVHIARQICAGLAAAHDHGIVHRDLKPDNVHLIERDGDPHFVKILDFGIAKVQSSKSARTRTGSVFGTPHYMSPEQAQGERSIDSRTDVYALGVLLYEMVTGRVPFDADNMMGVLTAHLYQRPVPPRRAAEGTPLSEGIEAIVLRALSKHREGRYDSMQEFGEDLDRLATGQQPTALTHADADTSVYHDPDAPPEPMVMAPHALAPAASPATVPSGRVSIRAPAPDADEPATEPSNSPLVAVGTGRSIPPVTGNGPYIRRSHTTMLAAILAGIGVAAFALVVVITVRHGSDGHAATRGHTVDVLPVVPPAPTLADAAAAVLAVANPVAAGNVLPVLARSEPDTTSPTIRLRSDPPGAIVMHGRRRIGVTPIEVARPQHAAGQTYTLTAPGRIGVRFTVRTDTASDVEMVLPGRAESDTAHHVSHHGGRTEILDPWSGGR